MKFKRVISVLIVILMCVYLLPLEANAAVKYFNQINVIDTAPGKGIMAKDMYTGEDIEYNYYINDGDVVIISFFNVGCVYCSQMFQSIIDNGLNNYSKVKFVAIELSGASREDIQAYIEPYTSQFQIGSTAIYYNNLDQGIFGEYARNILKRYGSFTLPVTFLALGENGNKTVKYYYEGMNTEGLKNSVLNLLGEDVTGTNPNPNPEPNPIDENIALGNKTIDIPAKKMYSYAKEVFKMVNVERAKEGLSPLSFDENLTEYAMERAAELVLNTDHTRPNGTDCFTIIQDRYSTAGENVAAGQVDPNEVMLSQYGWMNSPGHRANIMNNNFSTIGVGCIYNNGTYYWVQLFSGELKGNYTDKVDTNTVYTVETIDGHIKPYVRRDVFDIDINSKESFSVFNTGSQSWISGRIIPYSVGNVIDRNMPSNIIATTTVDRSTGAIEITPVSGGSGMLEIQVYNGQRNPIYVTVNITGDAADTGGGNEGTNPDEGTNLGEGESTPEFVDIQSHWAKNDILKAVERGLFKGTSDTTFSPDTFITRQQMWLVLSRYLGEGQNNFESARDWAMTRGISDGSNPSGELTREQFVTLLWRALGEEKSYYDLSGYSDYNSISDYARDAFAWAVEMGLVNGTSADTISPRNGATRAQIATIFERLY